MRRRVFKPQKPAVIGSRLSDRFDPSARDADGDGMVQDATRFERPQSPVPPKEINGSMAYPRVNKDIEEGITQEWEKGDLTKERIAAKFGVSVRTVENIAKRNNLKKKKSTGRKITPEQIERNNKIVKMYNSGDSIKKIASENATTESAVSFVLTQARKRGEIGESRSGNRASNFEERNSEVVRLRDSGMKITEISQQLGIPQGTVASAIYTYGRRVPPKQAQTRDARTSKILAEYDKGKSVQDIATSYRITPGEVLTTLVAERLPDSAGKFSIERNSSNKLSGSITKTPETNRRLKRKKNTGLSVSPSAQRKPSVATAGMLSGSMANENPHVGKSIEVKIEDISETDSPVKKYKVNYGDLVAEIEYTPGNYSEWTDAYDLWVGWRGNYSMRIASSAIMGLPTPKAFGYLGDEKLGEVIKSSGTHHHDMVGTGRSPDLARSEVKDFENALKNTFIALEQIHSGREISLYSIYRGLSEVSNSDQLMNLSIGETISLPLSAFTSDLSSAVGFAVDYSSPLPRNDVIVEVLPGAKIANAAGEEYLHEFNRDGKWVIDVTEQVTQGKFKYLGTQSVSVITGGKKRYLKKIMLQQTDTFSPSEGKYEKISKPVTRISGAITKSKIKDRSQQKILQIRDIVEQSTPNSFDELVKPSLERMIEANLVLRLKIKEVGENDSWKSTPEAKNPDGTIKTAAEFIKDLTESARIDSEQKVISRLSQYSPDFTPNHLSQLRNSIEMVYLESPALFELSNIYGFPSFAIFNNQQIVMPDGKIEYKSTREALARNIKTTASGTTIMNMRVSAVHPRNEQASFLPPVSTPSEALQDMELLTTGLWGIKPELLIETNPESPNWITEQMQRTAYEGAMSRGEKVWTVDGMSSQGTIRHEIMHSIHSAAVQKLAQQTLENFANKTENSELVDRRNMLIRLLSADWQSIPSSLRLMLIQSAVSEYARTTPAEWITETLSAILSPNAFTRNMVDFNSRAFVATIFPELNSYLMDGDWP